MADVSLPWNTDVDWSVSGDLLTIDGDDMVQQRIERRLFTAVQGYVWHLDYGAGLLQKIGSTYQPGQIEAIVRGQMLLEDTVSQIPAPKIRVWADPNNSGMQIIRIDYVDAPSGRQIGLTITV